MYKAGNWTGLVTARTDFYHTLLFSAHISYGKGK